jgi:uncharacterized protein
VIFWDSSAIVPLILAESASRTLLDLLEEDPDMLVWWGSPVECGSAVSRRERDGDLGADEAAESHERLDALSACWNEVNPSRSVRNCAIRILRLHPLRAADALQLAAGVVASEHNPSSLKFLTLDDRMRIAARKEGFRVVVV